MIGCFVEVVAGLNRMLRVVEESLVLVVGRLKMIAEC